MIQGPTGRSSCAEDAERRVPTGRRIVRVPRVGEQWTEVVAARQLIDDRRQPDEDAETRGDREPRRRRRSTNRLVVPISHDRHHAPQHRQEQEAADERQIAGVGLRRERSDRHREREHEEIAAQHRPDEQQEHDEREEGRPGIPWVEQHPSPLPCASAATISPTRTARRAPPPVTDRGRPPSMHSRFKSADAGEDPGHAEHPVEGRQHPEQQRAGMRPAPP